ncbi:MAG: hypothetical protein GY943_24520 [Chloroflexi bacterium]|nr:hypothetical protein [Chloroflexota bacterium]
MKDELQEKRKFSLLFLIALVGVATIAILVVANSATADYTLPPRSEPVIGSSAVSNPDDLKGGRLFLRVHFSEDWPWDELHWQEDLWHVVQWHDHDKTWRDVDGWQGSLDSIAQENGWIGQKELWIDEGDLGAGPFRWMVYDGNGRVMATSPEFYLPGDVTGFVEVDLGLEP